MLKKTNGDLLQLMKKCLGLGLHQLHIHLSLNSNINLQTGDLLNQVATLKHKKHLC